MDEEILSRLITYTEDVVLAIVLNNGKKMITNGKIILSGKIEGELASFILRSSKEFLGDKEFGTKKYKDYEIYFEKIHIEKYLKGIGNELIDNLITLKEFINLNRDKIIIVDVRCPREFKNKTIPGAINIPLFLDEEYDLIGRVYKREGKDKVMDLIFDTLEKNLSRIFGDIKKLDRNKLVIIFCARGGLRSQAMATFLKLAGFNVKRLIGGFKGYNLGIKKDEQ
ncbi:MAG TPA: selenouridine synthase SelU-like subunit [Methanothermococcus okinawensis]|uniref:Selenouridine synthase SelU-like subunit n=1 Tax=Methanothermococcus okinawensis TaxID=155863 RepID=A0A832YT28_9EURY|nr:selenouridine synthase SelU-like subunit [Methanothermococcus okinawensis]